MKKNILRFFLSALLYYIVDFYTGYFLVMPDYSIIGMSSFLPPLLGIMWGPIAAFGSMIGALLTEYEEWLVMPQLLQDKGMSACIWQGMLLFCNCGFWAFIAAYMPWRLGHSLFINAEKPLFGLRPDVILKFVWLMFITTLTSSLFLAMTTDEADMLRLVDGLNISLGSSGDYALTCFLNDFDFTIFCGLMWFFLLASYDYPFHRPKSVEVAKPKLQRAFDIIFVITVIVAIFLCQPQMIDYEKSRLFVGFLLCLYMFRPLSPLPKESSKHEKIIQHEDIIISRKIAVLFYSFIFAVFLVIDVSGIFYGLKDINIWRQFNAECITMINVALIALICMLLRYHHSIMTNIVMLEVVTVFISSFALGGVCILITDRTTTQNVEDSIEKISILCRERLERTFNNIQVSVNDIRDLALSELESYDLLTKDENWRNNYLRKTEHLFRAIASNTDGSVAFYLRLSPEFAGPLGGFSWGREKNDWEGATPSFYQRTPIDLSKYAPTDKENVGWYYIPVSRRNSTWIEPYIDPTVQTYVISYVSPLYIDDKIVGVVGMDIDFEYLVHEIRRMSAYNYGFVYLVDRNGKVLYHRLIKQGDMFTPNPDFREEETYLTNGIWIGIAIPLKTIYSERNALLMHLVSVMLIITMLVSFFSIYLASRGVRPLVILTEAAQKIASGNLNVQLPDESRNELGTLVKSIREMVSKLEIYVYRDKLTGLSNTTAYARKCKEIAELSEGAMQYAVVVFDVNFLKRINDTYGHEAGNELIITAANIVSETFSKSAVFRIGGDEFVAILDGADYNHYEELLNNFDKAIEESYFTIHGYSFNLSVARGIGIYREGMSYAEVFQIADDAMYAHKTEIKKKLQIDSAR